MADKHAVQEPTDERAEWRADYRAVRERAVRAENALRDVRALVEASVFGSWWFKVARIVDKAIPNG